MNGSPRSRASPPLPASLTALRRHGSEPAENKGFPIDVGHFLQLCTESQ